MRHARLMQSVFTALSLIMPWKNLQEPILTGIYYREINMKDRWESKLGAHTSYPNRSIFTASPLTLDSGCQIWLKR